MCFRMLYDLNYLNKYIWGHFPVVYRVTHQIWNWVVLPLIFAIPLSARFCLGWVVGQDWWIIEIKVNRPDEKPCTYGYVCLIIFSALCTFSANKKEMWKMAMPASSFGDSLQSPMLRMVPLRRPVCWAVKLANCMQNKMCSMSFIRLLH